jgi:peptidoglycan/xylan/chitin deacetylase (PgdA/CDA1 family)
MDVKTGMKSPSNLCVEDKLAASRIPVLMYHRVGDAHNAWEARYAIDPKNFAKHMRALARSGYQAISINSLFEWLETGVPLPSAAFLLTFDDGFRGVRDGALPVLEQWGWPCTVFLVSDLIGGEDVWSRASNPSRVTYPLLNAEEIRDMQSRGVSFQSHSCSHASLPSLDDAELKQQLQASRQALAAVLQHEVDYIAYPFGHLDHRVEAATRAAGYRGGFSTQPGFNRRDVNEYRIRRLEVFGTDTSAMLLRKIRLGSNDGSLMNAARYYLDRLRSHVPGRRQL